jgi:hypothetical protein
MEVFLKKNQNGAFVPEYGNDFDQVNKIPIGTEVKAIITNPRKIKHHRKFFALLRLVALNLPENMAIYQNQDLLLNEVKIQLGHFEMFLSIDGNPYHKVKSISFGSMDQTEFEEFYSRTIDVVLKYFLKGTDREELIQEVIDYI